MDGRDKPGHDGIGIFAGAALKRSRKIANVFHQIVRVLQRCLARSPFERFPDARALADALDAALRVAPVPGTRKDIGAQVKQAMERIAALHEGEMSGVLALNIGTGPIRMPEIASRATPPPPIAVGRADDFATNEFKRLEVEAELAAQ